MSRFLFFAWGRLGVEEKGEKVFQTFYKFWLNFVLQVNLRCGRIEG